MAHEVVVGQGTKHTVRCDYPGCPEHVSYYEEPWDLELTHRRTDDPMAGWSRALIRGEPGSAGALRMVFCPRHADLAGAARVAVAVFEALSK